MDDFQRKIEVNERLKQITQMVGFVLWQIQVLEGTTAEYFVLVVQAKKGMGLEAGYALANEAKGKTFGQTIGQMKKAGALTSKLENRFANLLSERNWLVHKSRHENKNAIYNDGITNRLLLRLEKIEAEARALLKEIACLSESFVKKHGISKAVIDKEIKELLDNWHASDSI